MFTIEEMRRLSKQGIEFSPDEYRKAAGLPSIDETMLPTVSSEGLEKFKELLGMDEEDEIRFAPDGTPIKKRKSKKAKKKSRETVEGIEAYSLPSKPLPEDVDALEEGFDSISVCAEDDAIVDEYFGDPEDKPLKTSAEITNDTKAWDLSAPKPTKTGVLEDKIESLSSALRKASVEARKAASQISLLKSQWDDADRSNREVRDALAKALNRLDALEDK